MNESTNIDKDDEIEEGNETEEDDELLDDDDTDDDDTDDDDTDDDDTDDDDTDDDDTDDDYDDTSESGRSRKRASDSVEPQDDQSKRALEFVDSVLENMDVDCTVHLKRAQDEDDRDIRLEVVGPDAARVIGKRGQVLGALQFLTNRALNRPGTERRYVTVDAEGYRSRRDDSLASMAKRLGKQAVTDGKIITFEPMPPRDRRLVHLALAKFDGVITKSEGEGEDRRVQIIPVRRSS
jgi:spoIIIJ-associated protein